MSMIPFGPAPNSLRETLFDAHPKIIVWVFVAWILRDIELLNLSECKCINKGQLLRINILSDTWMPWFRVSCDVEKLWVMKIDLKVKAYVQSNYQFTVWQGRSLQLDGKVKSVSSTSISVEEVFYPVWIFHFVIITRMA